MCRPGFSLHWKCFCDAQKTAEKAFAAGASPKSPLRILRRYYQVPYPGGAVTTAAYPPTLNPLAFSFSEPLMLRFNEQPPKFFSAHVCATACCEFYRVVQNMKPLPSIVGILHKPSKPNCASFRNNLPRVGSLPPGSWLRSPAG